MQAPEICGKRWSWFTSAAIGPQQAESHHHERGPLRWLTWQSHSPPRHSTRSVELSRASPWGNPSFPSRLVQWLRPPSATSSHRPSGVPRRYSTPSVRCTEPKARPHSFGCIPSHSSPFLARGQEMSFPNRPNSYQKIGDKSRAGLDKCIVQYIQ